jgi:hypothetical protein
VGEEEGRIGAIGVDTGSCAAHAAQRRGRHQMRAHTRAPLAAMRF